MPFFLTVGTKMPLKVGLPRHHRCPPPPPTPTQSLTRRAKNKPESADDNFACKLVSGAGAAQRVGMIFYFHAPIWEFVQERSNCPCNAGNAGAETFF